MGFTTNPTSTRLKTSVQGIVMLANPEHDPSVDSFSLVSVGQPHSGYPAKTQIVCKMPLLYRYTDRVTTYT